MTPSAHDPAKIRRAPQPWEQERNLSRKSVCTIGAALVLFVTGISLALAQSAPRPAQDAMLANGPPTWDSNHDGVYTCDEWKSFVDRIFTLADRNHDGKLDPSEFEAVRKADPTSKLIATGQDVDAYREWNAVQLANPPHTFDYLSTHFVVGTDRVRTPNASNSFIAEAAFALPIGLGRKLEEMTEQIKSSGHPEVKIAFTEWLFVSNRQSVVHAAPDFNNMGGAIATGGFLNMLISHADIVPISDMTGIIEFAGIWKKREQVYGAPGYWVLRSFAEAAPAHLLPVDSDAPKYSVKQGVDRLPEIPDVPWLDVTAATNADGDVVLFCVNRSLERDYRAEIHLDGFNASSTVTTKTISAPSIYDRNSEDDPDAVGVEASTLAANKAAGGSSMKYVFPHSSVVVLQFHRASAR